MYFVFCQKKKKYQKEKIIQGGEREKETQTGEYLTQNFYWIIIKMFHCFGGNMEWEKRNKNTPLQVYFCLLVLY